jgi:hypothetical protein
MLKRAAWDEDRTREQTLRRRAKVRGLVLAKAYGQPCWFLFDKDHRAGTAKVLYSLDEASAVLAAEDTGAG